MVNTKKSLIFSALSLLLCCALLIGTTFAWFTDSVTNTGNKIQAGNLSIDAIAYDLDMDNVSGTAYQIDGVNNDRPFYFEAEGQSLKAEDCPPIIKDELWEPGKSNAKLLEVKNTGSLAAKIKLAFDVQSTGLMNALWFDFIQVSTDGNITGSFEKRPMSQIETIANGPEFKLAANGGTIRFILVYGMYEEAGNEYQGKQFKADVTIIAAQDTVESDGFGSDQYDKDAGTDEFKQGVTISGIAGVAESYDTIQDAYEAVKAMLVANSGLVEEPLNEEAFNAFFTDGGKITWTIYGNQKVTDTRMFSFGRAANRFGEGRHITEINIVGGNSSAALDLTAVNGTFALPYNWWNVEDSVNTALKCKNITFNGIKYMPSGTYQCNLYPTTYEFDGCTFNGNLYSYQNFDVNMTIKNCTFNAPADTQYAFMSQGQGGTITLDNNIFNNYTRGINLQRPKADFVVTNNTIRSTVSEPDRGAIQLTDGKSFVVTGNKVDVNAGNAFWFHDAATNADVTYTISNNDIKAPYIGYSGVTAFDVNDKITSSGNKFNSTDTTKCMKKDATVAEATNLTAIH